MKLLLLCVLIKSIYCASIIIIENQENWYETATFYEIFLKSFKDSNSDGVGDLQGIIQNLEYFKETGISAIILDSIFKSQDSSGEAVIDFFDIDSELGSLADFEYLIQICNEIGIRVILEIILNHTGNKHNWFTKASSGDRSYVDYYVWADSRAQGAPNNWLSVYNGSAWTWCEKRQKYYLHQFSSEQPDLNFRNPKVQMEIKDMLTFWLNKGVAGFKIKHVAYLIEDGKFEDEPYSNDSRQNVEEYGILNHIYTKDTKDTLNLIYDLRSLFDEFDTFNTGSRILITESYTDLDTTILYHKSGDGNKNGSHVALTMNLITDLTGMSSAKELKEIVQRWYNNTSNKIRRNWVLGNSDTHRLATRLGMTDGYLMLASFLPGATFTYYGDEIGQTNGNVTYSKGKDFIALKNSSTYQYVTRDFQRTPFQWNNNSNAGFSDEISNTWLPVNSDYRNINLESEKIKYRSSYKLYKNLTANLKPILNRISSNKSSTISITNTENLLSVFIGTKLNCPDVELYAFFFNLDSTESYLAKFDMFDIVDYEVLLTSTITTYQPGHRFTTGEAYLGDGQSLIIKALCK